MDLVFYINGRRPTMKLEKYVEQVTNIPENEFNIATGLIMEYQDCFVFSIQNQNKWRQIDGVQNIGLVGIGGGREGNESVEECLLRECVEEINESIELVSENETILLKEDVVTIVDYGNLEFLDKKPYAITIVKNKNENYRGKPYTIVFSYRTILDHMPTVGDIYGFVLCNKENIYMINEQGMNYKEWIALGTRIIAKGKIGETSKLVPFGTFRSFIRLWKERNCSHGEIYL